MIRPPRHCPPPTPGSANHLIQCHLQHSGDLGGKSWRTETPREVDNASNSPTSRWLSEPVAGWWAPRECCGPKWKARLRASRTSSSSPADAPGAARSRRAPWDHRPPAPLASGARTAYSARPARSQPTRDSRCLVASKSRRLLFGTRRPAVPSCAQRVPPSAVPTARGAPQGA